jgi:hypothetical protein
MTQEPTNPSLVSTADQSLVLSSLEHDQLVGAKKHHIPRRHLKGPELVSRPVDPCLSPVRGGIR